MEDVFKCNNCGTQYSARKSYCPACGVHKWYKKPGSHTSTSSEKEHIPQQKEETFKSTPHNNEKIDPKPNPEIIQELEQIDDVEQILTEEITIEDEEDKSIRIIRIIIIALLILINITALNSLINKRKEARTINEYNQAIAFINSGQLQQAGTIILDLEESAEKTFLTGLLYFKAGNYPEAKKYFQDISANPAYSTYIDAMMGYILYTEGKYQESYNAFRRAVSSLPNMENLLDNFNNIRLYIVRD